MKITAYHLLMPLSFAISGLAVGENQAAHVHGLASLTMALENNVLEIQFESPAENLLGFEHKARTAEQKRAVKQAQAGLNAATRIFIFEGTECKPEDINIDMSGVVDDEHGKHQHHHNHHAGEHNDAGHSEITAAYRFSCRDSKGLNVVSVMLFSQFPGIETINAMWVTEAGQGAKRLGPDSNKMTLR